MGVHEIPRPKSDLVIETRHIVKGCLYKERLSQFYRFSKGQFVLVTSLSGLQVIFIVVLLLFNCFGFSTIPFGPKK